MTSEGPICQTPSFFSHTDEYLRTEYSGWGRRKVGHKAEEARCSSSLSLSPPLEKSWAERFPLGTELSLFGGGVMQVSQTIPLTLSSVSNLYVFVCFNSVLKCLPWTPGLPQRPSPLRVIVSECAPGSPALKTGAGSPQILQPGPRSLCLLPNVEVSETAPRSLGI